MMEIDKINQVKQRAICLYTPREVRATFDRMADALEKLSHENPVMLCVMLSGIVTCSELMMRLSFPLEIDYVHATRFEGALKGGELKWKKSPSMSLTDRVVIVVDDILDSGLTLAAIVDYCHAQGAKSVRTVVLADKKEARLPGGLPVADVTGFDVPNEYVIGCGMDYHGYLRNLPGVYQVSPEDI